MANQTRYPVQIEIYPRRYAQIDSVPNRLAQIALSTTPFTANQQQPDRFWPRPPVQDFQLSGATTRGIPAPAVTAIQFRAPLKIDQYRRPYNQLEQSPSLVLKTLVAGTPPFLPPLLPEVPPRRPYLDQFHNDSQAYMGGPVALPFFPVEFPTPMRPRAVPQDFSFQSLQIQAPKPFAQTDWQQYYRFRYVHQGFELNGATTRNIPTGVQTPFNQFDWPTQIRARQIAHEIPPNVTILGPPQPFPFFQTDWPTQIRARQVPHESYSSPEIVLTTVVLRPFSQTDWQLPQVHARSKPLDEFYFQAWNTIYRPVVPSGTIAMPNLVGKNVYEAMKILQQAGIYVPNTSYFAQFSTIKILWMPSTIYRGGTVIAQSIPAGNLVSAGMTLVLTIASFPFASLFDLPPDWKQ